ncbi:hypothetical protein K492DRAFT_170628 [Lichtheimia hyalospora FSU 10163]|nr:hypothetical protein K492DRAFT_170628 [Lichtheimia hyalospora FSU 10163]
MAEPKLCLRTYRPTDRDHVDFIFYSTYFALVPQGVKRKLAAPLTWVIGIGIYAYLLAIVPILLEGMGLPTWSGLVLRVFFTIGWVLVGFAALFLYTDRFEMVERVEAARQNDMLDPEVSYLNYIKYEKVVSDEENDAASCSDSNKKKKRVTFDKDTKPATELVREKKEDKTPSHFWVLEVDGVPCGMVGLQCLKERVMDQRPTPGPGWQRIISLLCNRYGRPNPFQELPPRVYQEPHPLNTATLTRLAVKYELQNCGLSTVMITRAMEWADEHGIQTVNAVTNECQENAAAILKGRHGFKMVKKVNTGWFGQYDKYWECNVKNWKEQQRLKQQQEQNVPQQEEEGTQKNT